MSKAVMISIQPQHIQKMFPVIDVEIGKIVNNKTIEVRKTAPTLPTPFKCYIYMTATKERCRFWEYITAYQNSKGEMLDGSQKVIGEFVCDWIEAIACHKYNNGVGFDYSYYTESKDTLTNETQLTDYDMQKYLGCAEDGECVGYAWHISNLVIYDTPKDLGEFWKYGYENDYDAYSAVGGGVPIRFNFESYKVTRPPQSWCYVEEM